MINPTTSAVTTVDIGNEPDGVAVSPTGPTAGDIYVTNNSSNAVSVLS